MQTVTGAMRWLAGIYLLGCGVLLSGSQPAAPRFEDFRVSNIYRGVVKPPKFGDLSRYEGTDRRCFGGNREDYSLQDVNFAGHFVIGTCTCGTGCHYLYMWDAVTAQFFDRLTPGVIDIGPFDYGGKEPIEYRGEQHRADSTLLIVEGCIGDTCDCAKRYYRWTGKQFKLILKQPVRMPATCRPAKGLRSPNNGSPE